MVKKKNNSYWVDRVANYNWKTYNSLEDQYRGLIDMYNEASLDIREELFKVTEKIQKNGVVTRSDMYKFKRLKSLNNNINNRLKELGEKLEDQYKNYTLEGAKKVYKNASTEIGGASFDEPNEKLFERLLGEQWKGSNFSEAIWGDMNKLSLNLNDILTKGIQQGKTVTEMAVELNNKVGNSFNNAMRIVRTETMHTLNSSALQGYKDSGVKRVKIWAAEDERMCDQCGKYHDKDYDIDKAPILPIHAHCRCTYIPIIEDEVPENKNMIEYKEAKNLKEAEKFVKDSLGIKNVSYKGVDIKTANEWNKGLTDNFNRFPKLKEKFGFVGESRARNKLLKPVAEEYYLQGYIENNKKLWESGPDNQERIKRAAKRAANSFMRGMSISKRTMAESWSPKTDVFQQFRGITVNSDYGKDFEYFSNRVAKDVETKFHPVGCESVRSILDHEIGHQLDHMLGIRDIPEIKELFDSRSGEQMTEDLSTYAWKNGNKNRYAEMIAEAWSEYCNSPEPREIAKTVGEIIEKEYKKLED